MKTSNFLFYPLVCTLALPAAAKTEKARPNVLVLFCDQYRADAFGFAANPDALTPNLDAMARKGTVFNRAYSQDAVSGPSRAVMVTGLYPRTNGKLSNGGAETSVHKSSYPLQKAFQDNGYTTYAFGKRHLHGTIDQGWDVIKAHAAKEGEDNYVKWIEQQGQAEEFGEDWSAEFGVFPEGNSLSGKKYPRAEMGSRLSRLKPENTMEAYSARNTIEMISRWKEGDKPFYCFTSFYRPHQPYTPLMKYLSLFDYSRWGGGTVNGDGIRMPETLHEPASNLPPALQRQRGNLGGIWCLGKAAQDEQLYRLYIASYYALVAEIDYWVGEIFKALDRKGLAENTIVVFTSDHGDFVGNHGMIEKCAMGHNVYEETLRIPFIFRWDGKIKKGMVREDLVGLIDLYPTLVDLCGLKLPELKYPLQGLSLARTLTKGKDVGRDYMVSENWSQSTVITPDYKLGIMLERPASDRSHDYRSFGDMFFVRDEDPMEISNRIADPNYTGQIALLRKYYADFCRQVSDQGRKEADVSPSGKRK